MSFYNMLWGFILIQKWQNRQVTYFSVTHYQSKSSYDKKSFNYYYYYYYYYGTLLQI